MIDIESAKKELINHVNCLKIDNPRVGMKLEHIMRVSENCKNIALNLKLSEEEIKLAELIGLLHDIGRFEQYIIFNPNTESKVLDTSKKFDHGEAGVQVLKKDNYIRKYIEEDKYDEIIYTAVYEHNKYQLSEGLSDEEILFSKIVKDADKMDLMHEALYIYWQDEDRIKQVEEGILSEKMLENVYEYKLADNRNRVSETDQILRFASFVFDIYFPYSLKVIKEKDYVSKMIDRFDYKILETKDKMVKVRDFINDFLNNKL